MSRDSNALPRRFRCLYDIVNVACSVRRCGACLRWYSMSVMNLRCQRFEPESSRFRVENAM